MLVSCFPFQKTSTYTFPRWSSSTAQADNVLITLFCLDYQRTLFYSNWQKTQSQPLHYQSQGELCKGSAEKEDNLENEMSKESQTLHLFTSQSSVLILKIQIPQTFSQRTLLRRFCPGPRDKHFDSNSPGDCAAKSSLIKLRSFP